MSISLNIAILSVFILHCHCAPLEESDQQPLLEITGEESAGEYLNIPTKVYLKMLINAFP